MFHQQHTQPRPASSSSSASPTTTATAFAHSSQFQQPRQQFPLASSSPPPLSHSPFLATNALPPPSAATAFAHASAGKIHLVGPSNPTSISSSSSSPSPNSPFRSFVPGAVQTPIAHTKRIQAYMSRKVSDLVGGVLDDDAGESRQGYQQLPPPHLNGSADAPAFATATSINVPPPATSPNGFPIGHQHPQREGSVMSSGSGASAFFYPSPNSGVSRAEVWRMLANRVYFSKFYKAIYVTMTILALITVVLSFVNTCPTTAFLVLECIVNLTLILEVGIRFLATRRQFFQSRANVLDVILVVLCLFLLGMVLHDAKSCKAGGEAQEQQRREALADSVLLIIRNTLQLARIINMVRKNQNQLHARVASVDFTGLEDGGHQDPLLFDAEDEQLGFGVSITPAGNQRASNQSLLPR